MKRRTVLGIAVAAAAISLAILMTRHSATPPIKPDFSSIYPPLIFWGEPSAPEQVTFLWGSRQASADAFTRYVIPLIAKARSTKTLAVAMIQEFGDEQRGRLSDGSENTHDLRGPGSLLFCAQTHPDYVRAAFNYLTSSADRNRLQPLSGGPQNIFAVNAALLDAIKQSDKNFAGCTRTDAFYNRLAFAIGFSKPDRTNRGITELPAFIVKNHVVLMRDTAGLRQIEKMGTTP